MCIRDRLQFGRVDDQSGGVRRSYSDLRHRAPRLLPCPHPAAVGSARSSVEPAIGRQPVRSGLAIGVAFLAAAERTRRVELAARVRPGHAGAQLVDDLENLAALVRACAVTFPRKLAGWSP